MYYEEKLIDGILHWRGMPDGEWQIIPAEKLDERVIAAEASKPKEKNPAAVALGRLGGAKGGKARAAKLSKKKRSEIAKKAAAARWKKSGNDKA
jgi:hypothetical protein